MSLDRSKIKKILLISLTNIGDVILTLPVLDILKRDFPSAKLSIVIGPKARSLFSDNYGLDEVIIFDKHQSPLKMLRWIGRRRKAKFDLVVDLRNSAIPLFLTPPFCTPLIFRNAFKGHMREKHLRRLKMIHSFNERPLNQQAIIASEQEKTFVGELVRKEIKTEGSFCVIAPGAADSSKRYREEEFARLADKLIEQKQQPVVFVGDQIDYEIAEKIRHLMRAKAVNLCGCTTLVQLAVLFKRASLVITNDSAPLHLASYLDKPVLAIFGPTDPFVYGPWSRHHAVCAMTSPADELYAQAVTLLKERNTQ